MNRCSGWVEVVVPCGRPSGRGQRSGLRRRTLARVAGLVDAARDAGFPALLTETDGRWHVWIEDVPPDRTAGLLPLFKALGSVAPRSCGVLDLAGSTGAPCGWVMRAGSVDLVPAPDLRPLAG